MTALARLEARGLSLPKVGGGVAAYVPHRTNGNTVYISGQLPLVEGKISHPGKLETDFTIEEGQKCAEICALNLLAQLNDAAGSLDNVTGTLRLEILVACPPEFDQPHVVGNGASELIKEVLGEEAGAHARIAYGVASLPMNAAVEVAGIFTVAE